MVDIYILNYDTELINVNENDSRDAFSLANFDVHFDAASLEHPRDVVTDNEAKPVRTSIAKEFDRWQSEAQV